MNKRLTPSVTKKTETVALLAALALFHSSIEYIIPKPLPFLRLGIANLPILISLYILRPKQIIVLVAIKIIAQAFIYGTLFSYIFLFSCAGGVLILLVIALRYGLSLSSFSRVSVYMNVKLW